MRLSDQHLSADELESLGKEEGLSGELEDQLQQAREHAASCPACQRRLEVYPTSGAKLEKLRASQGAKKRPDCPSLEIWLQLAGGLLPSADQQRYTSHAATCDYCGPVLREVLSDFSAPMSDEESSTLSELNSSREKRSHSVTEQDLKIENRDSRVRGAEIVRQPRKWFGIPAWQASAAALILVGAVAFSLFKMGVFTNKEDTLAAVNQLLGQAYGERRTIDPRIPGAVYGSSQVTLGPSDSSFSRPQALFDAEAKLKRQLKRLPDDPNWLDAKGRAELLDGNFQAAVDTLSRASHIDPESDAIRTDLATAYFERGVKNNFPADCGKAADLLGTVLQKSPGDTVALFNRALVNEQLNLYPQAIEDWKRYLSIDGQGDWAQEAKNHLQNLQKKVSEHERNSAQPFAEPGEFVRQVESRDPAVIDKLEQRIEGYQDHAIQDWLPRMVTDENKEPDSMIAALQNLATLLRDHHDDRWLDDLLRSPNSVSFTSGLVHLGHALLANDNADVAGREAEVASEDFKNASSEPGQFRADLEVVHALRRAHDATGCWQKAAGLSERLRGHDYPWLATQLTIDQGSCALMSGKFDLADSYAANARQLAMAHGYRDLELRSMGLAAGVRLDEGDLNSAWAEAQAGLLQYWTNGLAPPVRAQFFYDELSYLAEDLGEWHSALSFAQESAHMLLLSRQPSSEALSRRHLAEIAAHTGDFRLASEQLSMSGSLLSTLLSTDKTDEKTKETRKADRLYSEIALGEIELEMGKLDDASKRLSSIQPDLEAIKNATHFTIAQQFYAVQSKLLLKQHRELEAEDVLLRRAELADNNSKQISKPFDRYLWSQENSGLYRTLVYLELLKGDDERAFSAWEWYKAGSLGHSHAGATSLREFWNTNGLRSTLAGLIHQTVVSYAWLPQGLAIWVADDHGVEGGLSNIDMDQLGDSIAEFYKLCSDRESDITVIQSRGRKLFDLLIAPVARRLDPHRVVVIELDDVMGDLALQALVTPEDHYFGQDFQVGFSAGLLYNDFLNPDSPVLSSSTALVVGSTANVAGEDISLFPAPDVRDHAKEIAARFTHSIKLIDNEANADAMKSGLPRSEIFHYVGHAISGPDKEGLLLFTASPDGPPGAVLWGAERITPKLFGHLKLAVLAACSTGRAHSGRTEKHGELVRNMLLAGVPHVIGSRWDVNSAATRNFMNAFYAALLAGRPVSTAMQAAGGSLMSNPKTKHPYYWAAFAAFGRA